MVIQKRKTGIKPFLLHKYHYLTKPSNLVSDKLLGPNVEQKITDSNRLNEAAKKLGRTFNKYQGRGGRFRSRGYNRRGYHTPGHNYDQNRFEENKIAFNDKEYKNNEDRVKRPGNFKPRGGHYNRRYFHKQK